MNIRIQVMANQARTAIQQVSGDLTRMAGSAAAGAAGATGAVGRVNAMGTALTKMGSQLQWTGRQLTYNFTLPLALAGGAATSFALKNEAAMVRVQKVYGDASMSSQQMQNETTALGKTFEVLSEKYGIARDQTIGIAADWAAAGSSGLALAKQTELTMQTMVLGELDATTATQALIAIQAQYNQSSSELSDTIARLNNVENQTGTTMADLIDAMSRSAGVARAAGVDVAHLAAMTAALTPAAGSASQAGNSLKTMISRLLAPTKDAMDILGAMNIHITDASWKSADAATRIELLSTHFEKLSDAQKQVVSSTLASRYQINKFDVLMDAINNKTSYYWKALDAASNRTQYLAQVQKELNMVLDSSPKKLDRIKVMLQNSLADAIQPILPAIISFAGAVANLAQSFNDLSPDTQKLIIEFLLFMAVLGPIMARLGALKIFIGTLMKAFAFLITPIAAVVGWLWGLASAVVGIAFDGFIGAMGKVGGGLRFLIPLFGELYMALVIALRGVATFALTFVKSLGVDVILTVWRYMWTQMLFFTGATFSAMGGLISRSWSAISTGVMAGLTRVGSLITGAWAVIGAVLAPLWSAAWAAVIRVQQVAMTVLETITAAFQRGLLASFYLLGTILPQVMTQIGVALAEVWTRVMYFIDTVMIAAGKVWTVTLAAIGTALEFTWAAVQTGLALITKTGGFVISALIGGFGIGWITIFKSIGKGMMFVMTGAWKGIIAVSKIAWSNLIMAARVFGPEILAALTNPYVLAAAAVAIALYAMRDKLASIWANIVKFFQDAGHRIVDAFFLLPKGVQGAMIAVVNIVKTAAMKVYELFSYLNPFAHHSPSLVENVTNGMAAVAKQFGTLPAIAGPINQAYASIQQFKNAALDLANGYDSIKTANEVADLSKAGASQGVISGYIALASQLSNLKRIQDQYSNAVNSQQAVVNNWSKSLDAANLVLDAQKNKLSQLQDVANSYKDAMSAMTDDIQRLASAPLVGMKAMDDEIFNNQQAQKRLQLQIAQTTQSAAGGYSSVAERLAALNGEIETLTSQKTDLRALGAGSEITGVLDKQIQSLQDQKKTLGQSADEVTKLNDQLTALQSQANILDLQKSLQFDGLTRAIDQAANGMQELPFDQVMAGIAKDQAGLKGLQAQYDQATAAVNAQQGAVDSAQASVDSIQASYDAAQQSLNSLKDSYDAVTSAIQDMNQAMSDANSAATGLQAAKDATASLSPTMQAFNAGAGGDFPDVGGTGMLGREGGLGDQSAQIDAMTKDLQKQLGDAFGGFDILGPFKDMWKKFMGYWDRDIWPFIKGIGSLFSSAFDGIDLGSGISNIFGGIDWAGIFTKAWTVITNVVSSVWDFASMIWDFIGPDVKDIVNQIIGFFKDMGSRVGSVWGDIKERIGPFLDALNNLWNIAKPFLAFMAGEFVAGIIFTFKLIKNIASPVLTFIGDAFHAVWEVIRGLLDIFIGVFTGDWKRVWDGFLSIFKGVWDAFLAILKGIGGLIWGVIKSIGETLIAIGSFIIGGIWNGIKAAWNGFISWLGGLWNGFIDWIKNILGIHSPSTVMAEIGGWLIEGFLDGIKAVWDTVVSFIKTGLQALGAVFSWLYDNVIKPVTTAIGDAFSWLWDHILKPVFDAVGVAWDFLGTGIQNIWNNVIKPAWDALGTAGQWLWDHILKPVFDAVNVAWNFLGTGIQNIWNNVIKPAWDALGAAGQWLWDHILKPVFDAVSAAWNGLGTAFKWVWDTILKPVFDVFSSVIGALKDGFQTAVDGIGGVWNTLKSILMTPVQWVIDFVWNNGLRKLWNFINNIWGGGDIGEFKLDFASGGVIGGGGGRPRAMATGGVMPGYTPGRDVHRFFSATGGELNLSGGEAVMRPEFTKALGPGWVNAANLAAIKGGPQGVMQFLAQSMGGSQSHARGGVIDLPGWLTWPLKFIPGGGMVTDIIDKINSGGGFGGGGWGDMLWGMVKKGGSELWDAAKSWFSSSESAGSGGGGTGIAGAGSDEIKAFIRSVDPKPYIWGAVGPGGYDCSGLAGEVFALMTGRPQFRRYFTTGSIGNGSQFGFKPGLGGTLNLGFNDHHVVGEYGGLGFEAQSTATGILTGSRATPPSRMPKQMHLASGGVIPQAILNNLKRQDITIGGDPSNPVFGPGLIGKDASTVAKKLGLFDTGGMMTPGMTGLNLSGRVERVLSPDQTNSFERLVNVLDRVDFAKLDARLNGSQAASSPVTYNYTGDTTTININGNLEFPGITSSKDTDKFLRNLADMAGGSRR